jgi:hypothetical protein
VSFIFTDDDGNPTDINGDNQLDTALNEVYYNNTFGDPASDRAAIRGRSMSRCRRSTSRRSVCMRTATRSSSDISVRRRRRS